MKKLQCSLLTLFGAVALFGAYGGKIELDKPSGQYQSGETVKCSVLLTKDNQPLKGVKARCTIKWESKPVEVKTFETTGKPVEFTYKSDKPGWVYFGVEILNEKGKPLSGKGVFRYWTKPSIVTEIGAIFDADKIRSASPRPADFEAFWAERRAKLDKLPIEPELKELPCKVENVKLYALTVPTLDEFPVTAYLAIPENAKPKSLPAHATFLSWSAADASRASAIKGAKDGYLCLAATWHGRPVNMGKGWYNYDKTIKIDGGMKGVHDRDTWCFSGMYYRVMRALDYLKTRPEWDGRNLVVSGGSLGGAQALAAAALDKDVTLAIVKIPGFCEFDGAASGRRRSIPLTRRKIADEIAAGDRRALVTVSYFDCVNFAPMVKCEIFMCTGGTDETCPPSGVYAAYNALPATTKKSFFFNPRTGHGGQIRASVTPKIKALFDTIKVNPFDNK